jgi:hypothetical protein
MTERLIIGNITESGNFNAACFPAVAKRSLGTIIF